MHINKWGIQKTDVGPFSVIDILMLYWFLVKTQSMTINAMLRKTL